MAQLVVRNIPDEAMHDLREIARRNGTSVESEVRDLIIDAAERAARLRRFVAASKRQIREWRSANREFGNSETLIREDRDG